MILHLKYQTFLKEFNILLSKMHPLVDLYKYINNNEVMLEETLHKKNAFELVFFDA